MCIKKAKIRQFCSFHVYLVQLCQTCERLSTRTELKFLRLEIITNLYGIETRTICFSAFTILPIWYTHCFVFMFTFFYFFHTHGVYGPTLKCTYLTCGWRNMIETKYYFLDKVNPNSSQDSIKPPHFCGWFSQTYTLHLCMTEKYYQCYCISSKWFRPLINM